MPVYEFRCQKCRKKFSILVKGWAGVPASCACPNCGSTEVSRVFSSFALRKSDKDVYDDILSDSHLVHGLESNDPRALAEWNKRMSRGEQVAPEYEEMIDSLEKGQMPNKLPDVTTEPEK